MIGRYERGAGAPCQGEPSKAQQGNEPPLRRASLNSSFVRPATTLSSLKVCPTHVRRRRDLAAGGYRVAQRLAPSCASATRGTGVQRPPRLPGPTASCANAYPNTSAGAPCRRRLLWCTAVPPPPRWDPKCGLRVQHPLHPCLANVFPGCSPQRSRTDTCSRRRRTSGARPHLQPWRLHAPPRAAAPPLTWRGGRPTRGAAPPQQGCCGI